MGSQYSLAYSLMVLVEIICFQGWRLLLCMPFCLVSSHIHITTVTHLFDSLLILYLVKVSAKKGLNISPTTVVFSNIMPSLFIFIFVSCNCTINACY